MMITNVSTPIQIFFLILLRSNFFLLFGVPMIFLPLLHRRSVLGVALLHCLYTETGPKRTTHRRRHVLGSLDPTSDLTPS